MNWLFILFTVLSCAPKTGGSQTGRSQGPRIEIENEGSVTGKTKWSALDSQEKEAIKKEVQSNLPSDASVAVLQKLTIPELKLHLEERKKQNQAEKDNLEILLAINKGLCERLDTIRQGCPAIGRLIPTGLETRLQCDGSLKDEDTSQKIEVQLSYLDGTPVPEATGKFILIVNNSYESSSFNIGPQKTTLQFRPLGADQMNSPKFLSVYKVVLRSATPGTALPPKENLSIEIAVGGKILLKSMAYTSEDSSLAKTEYKIDVSPILALMDSSKCHVSEESINAFKSEVTNTVKENQRSRQTEDYMKAQESQGGGQ